MLAIDLETLVINLLLNAKIEDAVRDAVGGLEKVEKAAKSSEKSFSGWTKTVDDIGKGLENFGNKLSGIGTKLTLSATLPLKALGESLVQSVIDYESAFAGIRKTVDATEEQFAAISDSITEMSNRLPFAAAEIAQVGEAAGQLGVKAENITAFSETMLKMGQATDLSATNAATSMARFAAVTQMPIESVDRLGSTIVALGNNFATTESEVMDMGMRLAAAGAQVGMTQAEIMGLAAAMKHVGLEAEAGGTAMSRVMLNIDMAVSKGGKGLEQYAKVVGMSAKDFKTAWEKDATGALVKFVEGLAQVDKQGGNLALTLESLGYTEVRTRDALMRAAGASEVLAGAVTMANGAWDENIALQDEAAKRNETMAARIQVLKNNLINTGREFGELMMPTIEKLMGHIQGIVDWLRQMDDGTRSTILVIAGMVAAAGPLLKTLGLVSKSLGGIVGVISKVGGAIAALTGAGPLLATIAAIVAVGAAVAGVVALIDSAVNKTDALSVRAKALEATIDEITVQQVIDGAQSGQKAYELTVEAEVTVEAKMTPHIELQESALSDGSLSRKEANALVKSLNAIVDPPIAEATAYLEQEAAAFIEHLRSFTVGSASNIPAEGFGFVMEAQGLVDDMGAALLEIKPALSEAQITELVKIIINTPTEMLIETLMGKGFTAEEAEAVAASVAPMVDGINNLLTNLGIADFQTRGKMMNHIIENVGKLRAQLSTLKFIDPATHDAIIGELIAGLDGVTKEIQTLNDKEGFGLSQNDITNLALAWLGGADTWNAAVNALELTEEQKAALGGIFNKIGPALSGSSLFATPEEQAAVAAALGGELATLVKDALSMNLYSEETEKSAVATMQEQARQMIGDLDTYRKEYNDLVTAMGTAGYNTTQAEIDRMNVLLGLIKEMSIELSLIDDAVVQRSRAALTLVESGQGTARDFGDAAKFRESEYKTEIAKIGAEAAAAEKDLNASLLAAQDVVADLQSAYVQAEATGNIAIIADTKKRLEEAEAEVQGVIDKLAAVQPDTAAKLDAAGDTYAAAISALFNKMAEQFPESAAALEAAAADYDVLAKVLAAGMGTLTPDEAKKYSGMIEDALRSAIPNVEMQEDLFGGPIGEIDLNTVLSKLISGEPDVEGVLQGSGFIESFATKLQEKIVATLEEGGVGEEGEGRDFFNSLFTGLLSGEIDTSTFDTSNLSGAILAVLKTDDFIKSASEGGEGVGQAVIEGTALGLADASKATEASVLVGQALIDAFKLKLGINSPSKAFEFWAKSIHEGIGSGINAASRYALDPLQRLATDMGRAGQEMINGLINGIRSRTSELYRIIEEIAREMLATMENALEIASPSKAFAWIGEMSIAGLTGRLEAGIADVARASDRLADAMMPDISEASEFGAAAGRGNMNYTVNINSPKQLSLAEIKRQERAAYARLAMTWRR